MIGVCPYWPDCGCGTQSGPHTCEWRAAQPKLGPLGMGSAEGIKNQAEIFKMSKQPKLGPPVSICFVAEENEAEIFKRLNDGNDGDDGYSDARVLDVLEDLTLHTSDELQSRIQAVFMWLTEKQAMTFEPIPCVYPEMAMWRAERGGFTFVVTKDGDDPFMASAKTVGAKAFEGERHDFGGFNTFVEAAVACELWRKVANR